MPKILLVEDNFDILYANKMMLELEDYEVLAAENATQGRELALKETPDLIIMDIMLPDGNGLELCKELNREKRFKVIFLSAMAENKDILDSIHEGGYDYIKKPYIMDDLLKKVSKVLSKPADN